MTRNETLIDVDAPAPKESDPLRVDLADGKIKVRKLTSKECWRLMGFDDDDYAKAAKVCSPSQLYKQAGNSIVVDVLCDIFKCMM